MATPYIVDERVGVTYEIVGTFKDKKEYEKEQQKETRKETLKVLSKEEFDKYVNKEISEDEKSEINLRVAIECDFEEISVRLNRKYICKMISRKYALNQEAILELIEYLDLTYGEEQVDDRFAKIIDKVFTQLGVVEKKAMPMWGMEE